MAYIGKEPADAFTSFVKQDFTTSATTSYTLDHSVVNENELALFINFVRQEPTTAYTASGTTLTLTSATASTDDMYCVYLGKAIQTVNPPNGSVGTAQLGSDAVTEAKIADSAVESEHLNNNIISGQTALGATPADTDEFLVSDAGTIKRVDYSYIKAGTNTPAFLVTRSGSQSVPATTSTKIEWNVETIDTANNFASNRFTPTTAGYYLHNVIVGGAQNDDMTVLVLKKNGSTDYYLFDGDITDAYSVGGSITLYANGSSDYFEVFLYHGGTGSKNVTSVSHWSGFKLIGV